MSNRTTAIVALLVAGFGVAAAQSIRIEYAEGDVRIADAPGDRGREAFIGDGIEPDATILLGADGYAEVAVGGRPLMLLGPGRYAGRDLTGAATTPRSSRSPVGRLQTFLIPPGRPDDTVAGVRGDYAGEDDWSGGSLTADLIAAAGEAETTGDLEAAISLLEEALLYGDEVPTRLRLARVALAAGDLDTATDAIGPIPDRPAEPWYGELVPLTATIVLRNEGSGAFLAYVAGATLDRLDPPARGRLRLIQADVLFADGRTHEARSVLESVVAEAPTSAAGRAASRLLDVR